MMKTLILTLLTLTVVMLGPGMAMDKADGMQMKSNEMHKKGDGMGKTKREGRVRLNARITKVPGGEVVWAGDLDGLYTDEVPSQDIPVMENYHYSFFEHGLPLQEPEIDPSRFFFFATQHRSTTSAITVAPDFATGGTP